jgi:hypothetical protein
VKAHQLVTAFPAQRFRQALSGVCEIIKVSKIGHAGGQNEKARFDILAVVEERNLLAQRVKNVLGFRVLEDGKTQAIAHHFSTGKRTQVEVNDKRVDPAPRNVDGGVDT